LDKAEISFFSRLRRARPQSETKLTNMEKICGVDASYGPSNDVNAVAVLYEKGDLREIAEYSGIYTFPYVSGLFYLHEGPFVVAAVEKLGIRPQLICFNAHGAAHPRFRGLATICGELLGIPSIGIAKSRLVGEQRNYKPGLDILIHKGKNVGFVTSEYNGNKFWSRGYSITQESLERLIDLRKITCLKSVSMAHRVTAR